MRNLLENVVPLKNAYILAAGKGLKLETKTYPNDLEQKFLTEKHGNLNFKPNGMLVAAGTYLQVDYLYGSFGCTIVYNNSVYQMYSSAEIYDESQFKIVKQKSELLLSKQLDYKFVLKNPDGTMFKDKKYKRQSDTFSALMTETGYYDLFYELAYTNEYHEKNPELRNVDFPDWLLYGNDFNNNLDIIKNVEVHKYFGAKKPTEKIDVNYYEKIKWHFDNIMIAMNYGLVTKDFFKKMDDTQDFSYLFILVYSPIEYLNSSFYNFESLKEDSVITSNFKPIKKNALKITKYGKTAIGFKDFDTMLSFYDGLNDSYKERTRMLTLQEGNRGTEIIRDGDSNIEMRIKKLEEVMKVLAD